MNIDILGIFKSERVGQYFSLKSHTPSFLRSSVIYKFNCSNDLSTEYIGKTIRHLKIRINEHTKPNQRQNGDSAIMRHLLECNECCKSDLNENFNILDTGRGDFDLKIKEALYIKYNNPNLNRQIFQQGSSYLLKVF